MEMKLPKQIIIPSLTLFVLVAFSGLIHADTKTPISGGIEQLAQELLTRKMMAIESKDEDKIGKAASNGSYWTRLDRNCKYNYINGLLDGILEGRLFCLNPGQEVSWVDEQVDSYFYIYQLKDILGGIDTVCRVLQDGSYPIIRCLNDVNLAARLSVALAKRVMGTERKRPEGQELIEAVDSYSRAMTSSSAHKKYLQSRTSKREEMQKLEVKTGIEKLWYRDCDYWVKLDRSARFSYITGLLDGILAARSLCKISQGEAYIENMAMMYFRIKKIEDMVDALDDIYADVANRNIPIDTILTLENARMCGAISSRDELELILLDTRKRFP